MKRAPQGWKQTRIGEVCEVVRGASPRPAGDPRYFDGDFLPWITVADVTGTPGIHLEKTKSFLTEQGAAFTRTIPPDTLILTNSGATLGVPKITRITAGANDGIAMLLNPVGATNEYLYFVLESRTDYFRNHLAPGNGQPNLNTDLIKEEPVLLPPVAEQIRITKVAALWDAAIEKTERLIKAKTARHAALTDRLYKLSNDMGECKKFGDFLTESTIVGGSGRHARKITVKLYGKGVIAKDEKRQGSENTQYFVRRAGQLIYSKLDFLNGAFGLVPQDLDGFESTLDLPAFDIDPGINPIWLVGYLTRPTYYTQQIGLARGQRKARRVHPADLLRSTLRVPRRELQDEIAGALATSRLDIDISKRALQLLKAQKRGLLQKLLTGTWRIPLPEPKVA